MLFCDHCGRSVEVCPPGHPWEGFYQHRDDQLQACWSTGSETAEVDGSGGPADA